MNLNLAQPDEVMDTTEYTLTVPCYRGESAYILSNVLQPLQTRKKLSTRITQNIRTDQELISSLGRLYRANSADPDQTTPVGSCNTYHVDKWKDHSF